MTCHRVYPLLKVKSSRCRRNYSTYHISMVVMEYVDGNMFAVVKQKMSEVSIETAQLAVRRALELLHNLLEMVC